MRLSRYSIIGIMMALLLSAVSVMPLFAQNAQGVTLDLETDSGEDYVMPDPATAVLDNFARVEVEIGDETYVAGGDNDQGPNDTLTITVTNEDQSGNDATITIVATETADTGFFTGFFWVAADGEGDDADDSIGAEDGDEISVDYSIRSESIIADALAPEFDDENPADEFFTGDNDVVVSIEVSDEGVGLGDDDGNTNDGEVEDQVSLELDDVNLGSPSTVTELSGGVWRVSWSLNNLSDGDHTWQVTATDLVGNMDVSDEFTFSIDDDDPEISHAFTGIGWDPDEGFDGETVVQRNSILVRFENVNSSVPDFLDAGSVDASDFSVDGYDVTSVVFPNVARIAGESTPVIDDGIGTAIKDTRNYVFLILDEDLESDDEPEVEMASGSVVDLSGNENPARSIDATDRLGPLFTVTAEGNAHSRPLAVGDNDNPITVSVTSDEELNDEPQIFYIRLATDGEDVVIEDIREENNPDDDGTDAWEDEKDSGDLFNVDGLFAIYILGEDDSDDLNNGYTPGVPGAEGGEPADGDEVDLEELEDAGLLFEFDSNLELSDIDDDDEPAVSLRSDIVEDTTDSPNPFLFINFNEAGEYWLDDEMDDEEDGVEIDSHDMVNITSVTLDGGEFDEADVSSGLDREDDDSFIVILTGLTPGEYTLSVEGEDLAGNELSQAFEFDFEVIEPQPYEVQLRPGWNLFSLPGNPATTTIDDVFPASHPATNILTLEEGVWQVATREEGEMWEGPLTDISGSNGYWVETDSSQAVEALLELPAVGGVQTPPDIPVFEGWNLVPVVDVSQVDQGEPDAYRSASAYFASITWRVAYTYNPITRQWNRMTPSTGTGDLDGTTGGTQNCDENQGDLSNSVLAANCIQNGQAVWVWAESDDTLVP